MGRPVHKRNFGADAGLQIQVNAHPIGGALGLGYIVKQKGSKRYVVSVDGVESVCTLRDAIAGEGDMTITMKDDAGVDVVIKKLYQRVAIDTAGNKLAWNNTGATDDDALSATDAVSIDITSQPSAISVVEPADAIFTVTATSANAITYVWQEKVGTAAYTAVVDGLGNYAGQGTDTLTVITTEVAQDGNRYRCVMTATDAPSKTTTPVVLTVTAP